MKFLFGEVFTFITDITGKIADIVEGGTAVGTGESTHGKNRLATQSTITGRDGVYEADVALINGAPHLRTFGIQDIESLRAFDPIADTWGYIGTEQDSIGVGAAGDTIRTQIAAGDNATLFPAVDVSTTVQAGDTEEDLANRHVADLNSDPDFSLRYFARRVNNRAVTVYITAREPGPQGERPNVGDYLFTATGTTTVTAAFDNIIRRSKITSLARDPSNPTLGILGISGSVTASEGNISGRFIEFAENGGSSDLLVNGSGSPVDFTIPANVDNEKFITSLRFAAGGNGMKFGQFFSKNQTLTNGVEVTIRSNNAEFVFPLLKSTEDFKNNFSLGSDNFAYFRVPGTDHADATLSFPAPIQLFRQGTFGTDDFIRVRIQDDLNSGLSLFNFRAFGFTREF